MHDTQYFAAHAQSQMQILILFYKAPLRHTYTF